MGRKKIRQHCPECGQTTTQVRAKDDDLWKCLCCESGKQRSPEEVAALKENAKKKKRLNIGF